MNYYIQGDAANADKIKAAFEKLGMSDLSGYNFGNGHALFYTYDCGGNKVIAIVCVNLHVADIIKTHPDYKELELPIEPKFKVGDWIVSGDCFGVMKRCVYGLSDKSYLVSDTTTKYRIPFDQQDKWHLWSIADAKDGDVLHLGCIIAIFKKYIGREKCVCYCSISEDGDFEIPIKNGEDNVYGCTNTTPATEEQCDLLFTKMREAGYEWDDEKKELHKIPHYDIANFKPFDRVLVRFGNEYKWCCDLFSHYDGGFHCVGIDNWRQCIPFNDDTKHLLGTTDMPSEEYINW